MSNSWRGPKHELAKPSPRPEQEAPGSKPAPAEAPRAQREAEAPRTQREPAAKPKPVEKPQPAPESRRKRETGPSKPAPKRGFDVPAITQKISQGVGWLGGVTLEAIAFVREKSRPLVKRAAPWFTRGGNGQLPRQTVVVGFSALVLVITFIIWMSSDGSVTTPSLHQPSNLAVGDSNLDALRPVAPSVGERGGQGTGDRGQESAAKGAHASGQTKAGPVTAIDTLPKPKLARQAVDPREKGKRYYTLATYSVNKEQFVLPLLEYLWSQGVEAAAINSHNSGFFQVVALQGFTREEVNQKAHKQYEDTLRRIGRKWKAEGGGDDNLQGLYLQEYAGSQAKLSITKAN